MSKTERIRLIYAIFLSVFVVAVGVAFICVAADIYYSGKDTGVIYSQAIVAARLKGFIAPMVILIFAIIAGGIFFPLYEVKAKRGGEDALRRLQTLIPSGGDGEEYGLAKKEYAKTQKIRLIVWLCALAAVLACVIASLCYVLNVANFESADINGEMLGLVKNVLPCVVVAFAAAVGAAIYNGYAVRRQIEELKALIKNGNRKPSGEKQPPKAIAAAKELAAHKATLWSVRGVVLVISVAFVIAGVLNGGAYDVLVKAINICQECIGLG